MTKLIRFCLTALQWLFAIISGGVIFASLLSGAFLTTIVATLAFVAVFPPLQPLIESKVPFWQLKLLKLVVGNVLLLASLLVTATPLSANVCQAPVDGKCLEHEATLDVDQLETAYIVASFPSNTDATEALLELEYAADETGRAVVYTETQALDSGQAGAVQFELPLNELPIGAYEVAIAVGETNITQAFELVGNPPRLNQTRVCATLMPDTCDGNYTLYLEDSFDTLYVTATPQHIRAEVPVEVAVSYIAEPGDSSVLNTFTGMLRPEEATFTTEMPLPSFKVGTYEVTISSSTQDFLPQTEVFTVWHTSEALDARAEGTLSDSTTQLSSFKMCEQVLTPEELAQLEAEDETESDSSIETIDDSDRCATDSTTFASGIQTLAADVDIGAQAVPRAEDDTVDLTFIWRFAPSPNEAIQEIHTKTIPIPPDLNTFVYTLTGPDEGYPTGNYEVLAFLETDAARPIRREFVVEE